MADLLSGMDQAPLTTASHSRRARKRKPSPSPDLANDQNAYRESYDDVSSDAPHSDGFDLAADASSDDNFFYSPRKRVRHEGQDIMKQTEKLGRIQMDVKKDEDEYDSAFTDDYDAFMDIDNEPAPPSKPAPSEVKPKLPQTSVKQNGTAKEDSKPPAWLSVYDSLTVAADESFGTLGGNVASSSTTNAEKIKALQPDGSFRFFWMDYLEHEGVLYFIGKTRDLKTDSYVSCCVTVQNLQRNLFVLPRTAQLDDDGNESDIVPGLPEVYQDFDIVRQKAGIKRWKGKFVKRKYAFGEADVPKEERFWLKAVYGFNGNGPAALYSTILTPR
jgi:DNA polymerase alpha subunit A